MSVVYSEPILHAASKTPCQKYKYVKKKSTVSWHTSYVLIKVAKSCLDHVITNVDQEQIKYGVLDETDTNHLPVYTIFEGGADMCKKH